MSMALDTAPCQIDVVLEPAAWHVALAEEVRAGLTACPRWLPATLFYDDAGAALFERITELSEYYLTRAESELLRIHAPRLMARLQPRDLVEIGSGVASKVRWLLDHRVGAADVRYLPLDVDPTTLTAAARRLAREYPFVQVHGVVGDFCRHLDRLPPPTGRRLVLFFGSTIGNLHPGPRRRFLTEVKRLLGVDGRFLLGLDLVKPASVLELAYNDQAGVTAAFNRNILRVVNREFGATFRPEAFQHHACYNAAASRVEMHLVPTGRQVVRVRELGLRLEIAPGETVWTESCYKFTRESAAQMLGEAGLALEGWYSDWRGMFALALAAPA
jgi:L-histidine N-alpha-methyltransferase